LGIGTTEAEARARIEAAFVLSAFALALVEERDKEGVSLDPGIDCKSKSLNCPAGH